MPAAGGVSAAGQSIPQNVSYATICRTFAALWDGADELIIITENYYGTYSPFVKAVLDRSIGLSTPLSTYRGGQMHHTLRYGGA